MKKYLVLEVTDDLYHAGSKATEDIANIAKTYGYKILKIKKLNSSSGVINKIKRQIQFYKDWNAVYKSIEINSIIILQHPFHFPQITRSYTLKKLKKNKKIKYISFIHDIEELRGFRFNSYYKKEFQFMCDITDQLISHNQSMTDFLISKGIQHEKIINLEIFDYIKDCDKINEIEKYDKSVIIAGNLDKEKCKFLKDLDKLDFLKINLYGPNYTDKLQSKNLNYLGVYPPTILPQKLKGNFGLVWDGDSINSCSGDAGKYLQFNNPHKLSLYLASGIPVIIWSKAAEARFVETNKLGICVNSLYELQDILSTMTDEDYYKMVANVKNISNKLCDGYYTQKAIIKAEENLGN